jgi:hypothetical protein
LKAARLEKEALEAQAAPNSAVLHQQMGVFPEKTAPQAVRDPQAELQYCTGQPCPTFPRPQTSI